MELLTVSNAAARLRRSEGTVRRWADSGRLKTFVRLADGSRLFRERDVLSLLDHNPEDCNDEQATSPARSAASSAQRRRRR